MKGVYTAIRKKFEVNKYNQVKRVECEVAIAFTESLTLSDLPKNYLRLTDHQIDVAERHGDFEVLKTRLTHNQTNKLKEQNMNILYKTTLITMAFVTWKVMNIESYLKPTKINLEFR